MQTTLLTQPAAQPKVQEVTELDVINLVRSYVQERKTAFEVYRSSLQSLDKLRAVEDLLVLLSEAAANCPNNPKQAIKLVLRCTLDLHFIAPTKTRKLHITWYNKIEAVMQACRSYLSIQKQ